MTAQLRQRVWDVFDRAADLPPGERAAFLEEAAAVLGSSPSTVKRDWRRARAWLSRRLGR